MLDNNLVLSNSIISCLASPQSPSKQEEWYMKGALDVVLRHCTTLLDGSPLTDNERQAFQTVAVEFGLKGLRGTI